VSDATTSSLSEQEWALVRAVREIPEGSWRGRALEILSELTAVLREPRCAEQQGDGAPCGQIDGRCDECERVEQLIGALAARLRDAAHQGLRS
jgi:hypothetical protein